MAEGRVKDPEGHQAFPIMGYIQRTDGYTQEIPKFNNLQELSEDKELNSKLINPRHVNWPDALAPKVIPFLNCYEKTPNKRWKFRFNELVEFDIEYIRIKLPNGREAGLGVATNVRPKIDEHIPCPD